MKIIGYTYEAAAHCVECTQRRDDERPFTKIFDETETDEHGLSVGCEDREGNPIHPIFSTDEGENCCDDCGCEIE